MVEWLMRSDGPIGSLTLSSLDGENRLSPAGIQELAVLAGALADEPQIRVIVITSDAPYFSLGWAEIAPAAGFEPTGLPLDPFGVLAELPLPVICGVDRDAFSAGLELALACDVRIASSRARFAFPETACGLIPLAGGTQRLPRLIGRGRAAEMILLGTVIDAEQAHDWGLINRVVEPAELESSVLEAATVIARRGPIAERYAKEALRNGVELPLARALRYELDLTVLLQTTADRAEGVRAFAEKRPPEFTGQ
ncbi:MAG: enoyl-CoA hydratase/isomerase family protein [Dehalococcoidia bacterium]